MRWPFAGAQAKRIFQKQQPHLIALWWGRRSNAKVQAVDRGDSYRWQGPSTWACYRPDADVLVPVFSPYGQSTILSPFAAERNISLLMRFDYPLNDGKSLVAHHGHRLRKELIDYWEETPLNGSDLGLRSTKAGPNPFFAI